MFLSDFDYELPTELIAQYPPARRRDSRLLVVGESLADRQFADLPALLHAGDLLVLNDTRVIRARLLGQKQTGGRVEILVERVLSETEVLAQLKASKTPKPGALLKLAGDCEATVVDRERDMFRLRLSVPVRDFLELHGDVPLPPYLNRDSESADADRYQTVYAREPGAVAAPTAGLHFDQRMLDETARSGVNHEFVTLHVGAGTFQPLREERIESNRLHAERVRVSKKVCEAVRATRASGGRVVAVGTTSVRALESASSSGELQPCDGETDLFIVPGYEFRSVDAMLTNFHLPRSSLLLLVAAFAGRERILDAYRHAVENQYRYFSYGDAMLLLPPLTT
ncbi:MAG: tRNA preQ1(34) S-adenosylmethionine ribosyltransferase-isomerase QueA [Proteobacteria bacterium]|nr:tRNA preQ1(34) S-adenosylmethionine ribosyltransferase-isomerase QueA [Pseudomonadota bacterium]TDJ37279.1 MAG: tRNA preQ1(34) S-adenosylmethionine ribosyltransferase-isomerase QueA [Gammaproteobacteria bacterium]